MPVLRDLKKLATEVVRAESEKALPGRARARDRQRVQLQQEGRRRPPDVDQGPLGVSSAWLLAYSSLRCAPGRSAADPRSCHRGREGLTGWRTTTPRTRSRSNGSRCCSSRSPCCAIQDAGGHGTVREVPYGEEGARVFHEVPGTGGPVGQRRGRRLPSTRRGMRRIE